jgi:hypothetical protein
MFLRCFPALLADAALCLLGAAPSCFLPLPHLVWRCLSVREQKRSSDSKKHRKDRAERDEKRSRKHRHKHKEDAGPVQLSKVRARSRIG